MNEQELKQRTKQFGLRVIKVVESLPGTALREQLVINCFGQECRWAQIIGRPAAEGQKQILWQKLVFRLKKPMNVYIGWRCYRKQGFFLRKDSKI